MLCIICVYQCVHVCVRKCACIHASVYTLVQYGWVTYHTAVSSITASRPRPTFECFCLHNIILLLVTISLLIIVTILVITSLTLSQTALPSLYSLIIWLSLTNQQQIQITIWWWGERWCIYNQCIVKTLFFSQVLLFSSLLPVLLPSPCDYTCRQNGSCEVNSSLSKPIKTNSNKNKQTQTN